MSLFEELRNLMLKANDLSCMIEDDVRYAAKLHPQHDKIVGLLARMTDITNKLKDMTDEALWMEET